MPVVLAPFPNIAMHVTEAPVVANTKEVYRGGLASIFSFWGISIGVAAIIVGNVRGDGFTKAKGSLGSGTAGIFPFGFTGKAVGSPRFLATGCGFSITMPRNVEYRV